MLPLAQSKRSTHAIEPGGEFLHCCIFADNFASFAALQSYLCGGQTIASDSPRKGRLPFSAVRPQLL
jgi:hypothetical protein